MKDEKDVADVPTPETKGKPYCTCRQGFMRNTRQVDNGT